MRARKTYRTGVHHTQHGFSKYSMCLCGLDMHQELANLWNLVRLCIQYVMVLYPGVQDHQHSVCVYMVS